MSKRLAVKLAVSMTALSALALLPGCAGEEDGWVISSAWLPLPNVTVWGLAIGTAPNPDAIATAGGSGQGMGGAAGIVSGAGGFGGGGLSGFGATASGAVQ